MCWCLEKDGQYQVMLSQPISYLQELPNGHNPSSVQTSNAIASLKQGKRFECFSLLRQCCNSRDLAQGKHLHDQMRNEAYDRDTFLGNILVQMYGKCGSLVDARAVFDNLNGRDVGSWNAMILTYAQNGHLVDARDVFDKMPQRNVVSWTAMISEHAKAGDVVAARSFFDRMPVRNVVSWNAMIAAYAHNGHSEMALEIFRMMDLEGTAQPNDLTILSVLDACARILALVEGKVIHACIIHTGLEEQLKVGNALVNMYSKCGSLEDAKMVFDRMKVRDVWSWTSMVAAYAQHGDLQNARCTFDEMPERSVVSWNAMIAAYAQNGCSKNALQLFLLMDTKQVKANASTFFSVLDACSSLAELAEGKMIHSRIIQGGFQSEVKVNNALINMYSNCGSLQDAREVFDQMAQRNLVSWTSIIKAYVQNGEGKQAICHFQQMEQEGVKPDEMTLSIVLDACSTVASVKEGKAIHQRVVASGFLSNIVVATSLVSMYGKCGNLEEARIIFDNMKYRSVISWNSLICSYAQNGCGSKSIELFHALVMEGWKPDEITFTGILNACNHAGLLDEGWDYFVSLSRDYALMLEIDHYVSIIDLLGRAGELDAAEFLIRKMSLKPDLVTWMTLLAACRIHGDVERGLRVAEEILLLGEAKTLPYVVLFNIYAAAGKQDRLLDGCFGIEEKRSNMPSNLEPEL